jgi:predicted Holliday junction resolvase-like endonuclease
MIDLFIVLTLLVVVILSYLVYALLQQIRRLENDFNKYVIEAEARHYEERQDLYNRIMSQSAQDYRAISGEKPKKRDNHLSRTMDKYKELQKPLSP